jgi:SAM-dependent methyltransferase
MSSKYVGDELQLFKLATHWKQYWSSFLSPYVEGEVLEVGAGNGANIDFLINSKVHSWTCLEPDKNLADQISYNSSDSRVSIEVSKLHDFSPNKMFDSLVVIDVLEHIYDHEEATGDLLRLLKPGGNLLILVPAHEFLFSKFDKSVGHYRRYNKKMLKSKISGYFVVNQLFYLDSVGLLISLANKILLRQHLPKETQILFWDKFLIKFSIKIDKIFRYKLGKSLIGIFKKPKTFQHYGKITP